MSVSTDHSYEPLAIIGMACRLPGADNLEQFWRLIVEGGSAIGEIPPERFDQSLYYDAKKGKRGKSYSKLAAVLSNYAFDPASCPIPDELVRSVDRTHLLMTSVAAEALRQAGMDPFPLQPANTAVFIGHAQGSSQLGELTYRAYLDEAVALLSETEGFCDLPAAEQTTIGAQLADRIRGRLPEGHADVRPLYCNMVAGTIAKAFGLSGQWLALNAACASSLHAMLLGARTLQLGRAEMVIVGGASDCKSDSLVLFSQAQTLSTVGTRPFDADADGLVMSEGYVALVMKTLKRALADGDPIQAVVRGLGVASDGRGKSLWAPRKEGQMKAMQRAYRSGVEMADLEYLEAHATSTQLGDATELETLGEVLSPQFPPGKKIPVTSVKANVGHTLEAAGIAGVIKTVLCMQHQTIPPAINIQSLNPKVDWKSAPYYIPQAPEPWNASAPGRPRRGAVNAFGIGGLNMHVVLDEFTESARQLVAQLPTKPAAPAEDNAVAVVGMGCVFPGASGMASLWQALVTGLDPKTEPTADRWTRKALAEQAQRVQPLKGGFITDFQYDWRKHKVPPKQIAEADPLQFMLLAAAEQALVDAGYDKKPIDRLTCGVVVGTEFGGDFCDHLEMGLRLPEMQHVLGELLRGRGVPEEKITTINGSFGTRLLAKWPSLVDETGSFTSSTLASRITKTLDLAGGAVSIDSGSTSALSGLAVCLDMLLSGDNDLMICAAGQRRMGPNIFAALDTAGLLAGSGGARNLLDASYDGVVPAEGVGVVVLKRLADARRDNDRIHTIIRGLGIAHHDSHAEALRLAAERSCVMAGVDLDQIALVELDTDEQLAPAGDELKTLAAAYGAAGRKQPLTIGSGTAQFGHLGGAAGIAALMKASLEVEHGQSVPTVGLQTSAAVLKGLVHTPRATEKLSGCRLAAVASWSKGLACHVILEQPTTAPLAGRNVGAARVSVATTKPAANAAAPATNAVAWAICRFSAATPAALSAKLTAASDNVAAVWTDAARSRFWDLDQHRLAIVADGAATLGRKLHLAGQQFQNPAARQVLEQQGIFYRERPAVRPRVAFLFPGQGSQYDGMLGDLVRGLPAAAQALRQFDATMTGLGYPTFGTLAWETPTQLGSDVWTTQVSMLLADAIALAALGELGIRPDLVLGHSYGEFVALYAAGAWDLETAIRATRARCDGIVAVATGDSGMLATDAPQLLIEQVAKEIPIQLYLANLNAPDQTVVGGKRASLEALAKALESHAHQARILAVPAAFHTPLMAGASRLLEQQLRSAELCPLTVPMISTVTNAPVGDAAEIRRNLAAQLTRPVRYSQLIAKLAADEPTVFVEVGPQQTLTRLNRRIVTTGLDAIACDNPKRPGVEPLLCVQALLECLGAFAPPVAKTPTAAAPARAASSIIAKEANGTKSMNEPIPHFDATERRRTKMRSGPGSKPPARTNGDAHHAMPAGPPVARARISPAAAPPPLAPTPTVKRAAVPPAPLGGAAPANGTAAVRPTVATARPPIAAPRPVPPAPAVSVAASAARPAPAELESFLINFVVEQTGYPAEVVDLDADLEADLGIDSIKKAQLFGELQEYFDVGTTGSSLSLDDFPTLRHVLDFLQASGPASSTPPAAAAPAIVQASAPVSNGHASAVSPPPAPPAPAATKTTGRDAGELQSFLINFVVEQTGYPAEVVDLDADLEADLGIDSIKKAQLFGELQEYFDIGTTSTALSLDDFPTLRHVLDFLVASGSGATTEAAVVAAPVATAAPLVVLERAPASVDPPAEPATTSPAVGNPEELESFLINFVVEQTGYPAEVVDLDADLEADLGIDSIKKAQLFGELQEYFEIGSTATALSLDDFPTLRHVLDFLSQAETSTAAVDANVQPSLATADPAPVVANSHPCAPAADVNEPVHALAAENRPAATPYETGWDHGQQFKHEIRRHLRHFAERLDDASQIVASSPTAVDALLSSDELDGLQGVADAVEVPLGNVLARHVATAPGNGNGNGNGHGNGNGATHAHSPATHYASGPLVPALRRPRPIGAPAEHHVSPVDALAPELPPSCVTRRFVLEMRDAPLADSGSRSPNWSGAAIVLGTDDLADALRLKLQQAGVAVHDLPLSGDLDEALAELEQIAAQGPVPHLFITTGRTASPTDHHDLALWSQRRYQTMELPFFVCQKWLQLATAGNWLDRCTLVAAASLGGDFGFARGADAAAGGALAGLLKAIFIEYAIMQDQRNLRVKLVDAPVDAAADRLCDNIFRELASDNRDYEVAFVGDRRQVPFAVEREIGSLGTIDIRPGSTWVATGGARGITAACALELGRRFALKLHLLGTTPTPQIDPAWRDLDALALNQLKASVMIAARQAGQPAAQAWQRVQKNLEIARSLATFAAAGVDVTYHVCDVSDRAALAETLDDIRRSDGPIEGILHGAGIDRSCRFERKQRDVVRQTIGAKVDGAAHLMALTRRDPIRHFIAFGSISGRLGSFGQADYSLASDMVCKLVGAYRRSRPWVKAIGFHWHPWDEVGMASRPETKSVLEGKSDLTLMPLAEGVAHLLRELTSDDAGPEVLITERRHWDRFAAGLGNLAEKATPDVPANAEESAPCTEEAAKELAEATPQVELHTHRCRMRALIAPLPPDGSQLPVLSGPAWIVGEGAAAVALAERLSELGCVAISIRPQPDWDQTLSELERLWAEQPAKHLFLMTGRETAPGNLLDAGAAHARRERGVLWPFFVAQRWYKLLVSRPELGTGTVVAAVSLGGDFGFSGQAVLPDGGSLAGLLKALHIEDSRRAASRVRAKVIDAPANEPVANLIDAILGELVATEPEVEVCWSRGTRRVVRPLPAALPARPARLIPRGGTWVVTGGARGITAIAARELARRYGWKLHLVGKSPAPQVDAPWRDYSDAEMKTLKTSLARQAVAEGRSPSEAWDRVMKDVEIFKNLRSFNEAGIEATYHACDIADRDALAAVLDEARRKDGPIQGVLHGAGVIDPSRFEGKRRELVRAQIGAKFDGTLNLMALTQADPLAFFIGFGSISGRFGGNGLTDYAAGNDALAKAIDWFRQQRPGCNASCIHWESWEGSGMATLPRFAWGPKSVMNMKYMQPEEGVRRLEQELEAGLPDSEVLYTFGDFYPMFYPHEQRPLGEFSPAALTHGAALSAEPSAVAPAEPPLLQDIRCEPGGAVGEVPLNPLTDTFLVQHRLRNKPLLPVVVGLEALLEAAVALAGGKQVVGFRQVQMLDGLLFHTDRPATALARATQTDAGLDCRLTCDFRNRAGDVIQKDRPYLRAAADVAVRPALLQADLPAAPTAWTPFSYPEGAPVYHGPAFRGVTGTSFDEKGGWGRIASLPLADLVGDARVVGWTIPSAVLDAALYACGIHLWVHGQGAVSLPKAIERLQLGRAPRAGEACLVYFACRQITSESATYDFTIVGEDRTVIVAAQGYQKVILGRGGAA